MLTAFRICPSIDPYPNSYHGPSTRFTSINKSTSPHLTVAPIIRQSSPNFPQINFRSSYSSQSINLITMGIESISKEDIAREQKVDMALDDIIKMSRRNLAQKKQRASNKSHGVFHGNQNRSLRVRQNMEWRPTLRQGVLAQKRTSFRGNNFPLAPGAAGKAAVTTFHYKPINQKKVVNWNKSRPAGPVRRKVNASTGGNALKQHGHQRQFQYPVPRKELTHNQKFRTLDSMFANMKEQRMNNGPTARNQPRQPWLRGRFGNCSNW